MSAPEPVEEPTEAPVEHRITRYASLGGFARAAALTPEQMRSQMRRVRAARTEKDNARRLAAGLPLPAPKDRPLSDEELQFWLDEVDRRFPDRVFANRMQKPRLALRLARENAARMAAQAFKSGPGATA